MESPQAALYLRRHGQIRPRRFLGVLWRRHQLIDKSQVATVLEEIGTLLELKGENPFKSRAYHNASRIIEGLDQRYNGPETLIVGKRDSAFSAPPKETVTVFKKEQKDDSFARQLQYVIHALQTKRQPPTNGADAEGVLKIVEKIYGHAK